ncbi:GAF and ANTAR domain-containing protein [Streptomyces sp. MST-110588]|uniref:ANTAR domain-containing protein n=1 Tax=Streptomyces sp. MST-110588 TaxID=2833628 RepID=UPI001F5C7D94|nr:GAF and ANTAR domain-containing protein [Streptomyces sp. MST-110588]UNO40840.1 GAF and ANTAR domain-containing protein [Streptomyces sp. MST-110588]
MTQGNGLDLLALHRSLADSEDLDAFLKDLTDRAVESLEHVHSSSVTLCRHGQVTTAASSDGDARRLDEIQYGENGGPCLTSISEGCEQHVADVHDESRWPEYIRDARAYGVRSVLALPLKDGRACLGALNLYARVPKAFEDEMDTARLLSAQAAGAVGVALRIQRHMELTEDLRRAMLSRSVIDQAIGIVMARGRVDADTALEILRRASQGRNVKLRDISVELVTQTGRRPPTPKDFGPRPDRR